jgi:segregation and condensation protein B
MAEQNTITQPTVLQIPTTVKSLIEALIFGGREPLSVQQIQALYEDQGAEGGEPRKIDFDSIKQTVDDLDAEYAAADRPYRIIQIAGGYQFATVPAYAEWLGRLYKEQARRKLSQSSIETLAIIAYRQPITKPEIESIRGVNCDYVLSTLLEKDLATIMGRAPTVGRPLLYGTSQEFLKHFGLNDLNDLPRPREIQEILGDSQFETERRMLEAQEGLGEKKEEEFKSRLPHIPKRKPGLDDDVKIVPKKPTREIKLRQTEPSADQPPQELKQEQPPPESGPEPLPEEAHEVPVGEPSIDQPPSVADTDLSQEEPVLTTEKAASPDEPGEEAVEAEEESSEIIQDTVTFKTATETEFEVATPRDEEEQQAEVKEEELKISPAETMAELTVPQSEEPYSPAEVSHPPDDRVEESAKAAEEVSVESMTPPSVEVRKEPVEDLGEVLPQAASEMAEAPLPIEMVPEVQAEVPVETEQKHVQVHVSEETRQPSSQPKSRWTTWKEKIRGFIKKLFG